MAEERATHRMSWQFTTPAGTVVVSLDDPGANGPVVVKLQSATPADPVCPYCRGLRIKNGTRVVRFRDIPTADGQPVVIDWLRQKFVCSVCHRSSHDQHAAFDRRRDMTVRLVEWIGRESAVRGFTAVAKQTSVNPKVARRVFRSTEKRLGSDVGLLSDAIAIELIDLAGSMRPAIIDAKGAFVFEVYASVKDMQARLPAFAQAYSRQHEHPLLVTDLSLVLTSEGPPSISDDLFAPKTVRVISQLSLEREVINRIWTSCEPFLRWKYPERDRLQFVRTLFARRESSMKKVARRRIAVWQETERELYAAFRLKEDFLNLWRREAVISLEERLEAWMQRVAGHPILRLDALVALIARYWKQILEFSKHDFLEGFEQRLAEITSLDKSRRARSFSTARATLLARGLAQEKEKLANLVEQFAGILRG